MRQQISYCQYFLTCSDAGKSLSILTMAIFKFSVKTSGNNSGSCSSAQSDPMKSKKRNNVSLWESASIPLKQYLAIPLAAICIKNDNYSFTILIVLIIITIIEVEIIIHINKNNNNDNNSNTTNKRNNNNNNNDNNTNNKSNNYNNNNNKKKKKKKKNVRCIGL